MSPAAASAYIAGIKALLAHEAALQRGAVGIRYASAQQLTTHRARPCLMGAASPPLYHMLSSEHMLCLIIGSPA
jgi:hypothetical protein